MAATRASEISTTDAAVGVVPVAVGDARVGDDATVGPSDGETFVTGVVVAEVATGVEAEVGVAEVGTGVVAEVATGVADVALADVATPAVGVFVEQVTGPEAMPTGQVEVLVWQKVMP